MAGSKYSDIPVTNPDTATADMLGRENESRKRLADLEAGLSHPNLTAHEIMGLASQAALDAHTASLHDHGGVLPTDYVLTRSGATYSLIDGRTQAEVGNGSEPGTLTLSAITTLAPRGGRITIGGREDFVWGSVPTIPAGLTRRLTITSTGPHVQLSAAAPRFLDLGSIDPNTGAPPVGSTFRNLTLDGIALDAAAVPTTETGHLLFGNSRAGSLYNQINFAGLRFFRCKVEDAHVTSGKVLNPIYLGVQQTADGQPENFIRDIVVDDLDVAGGLMAVSLVGVRAGTWTGVPNIWIDGWAIRNVRHDVGSASSGFATSSHVHVGAFGRVGRGVVENVYGYGSRDVAIELNNYHDVLVDTVKAKEYNGFAVLLTNHIAPRRLRDQRAEVRKVSGHHLAANNAVVANDASSLVCVQAKAGLPMGDTTVDGMKYYRDIGRIAGLNGIGLRIDGEHRSVSAEHFSIQAEGVNHSSTTEQAFPKYVSLNPANLTPVRLRGEVRVNGAVVTGAAAHQLVGMRAIGSLDLNADVRVGIDVTGAADFQTRAVDIGGAATTIKGGLQLTLGPMAATQPRSVVISGSTVTTIPDRFEIGGDFSRNAATSLDVVVGAGNEDKIRYRPGSVWRTTSQNPERWRVVGAAGEPAFTSPWRALGGGFQAPRFRKVGNLVYLDGVLGHDGAANGSTAFVLPVGHRPLASIIPVGLNRLDVNADGTVVPRGVSTGSFHTLTSSFWVD